MAPPSATETQTVEIPVREIKLDTTATTGDYKVLGSSTLDKEAEEGKKGFQAAKVT